MTQPIWTNEEQVTGGVFAPANRDDFDERFLGMRLQTNFRTFYVDFVMPRRFEEAGGGKPWRAPTPTTTRARTRPGCG